MVLRFLLKSRGWMLVRWCISKFLFRNTQPSIDLLVEAVSVYNIMTEFAEQAPHVNGPGTFLSELLDQLYQMNDITYKNQVKR